MANLQVVGVSVCGLPDGTALLVGPTGEEFRVGAPADEVAALLARCDGSAGVDALAAGSEEPDGVRALLEVLLEAGCLTTGEPPAGARWWARFATSPATPGRVGRVAHPVLTSVDPTPDHLVDERCGVILRIHEARKHPTVPAAMRILQGPVADMARLEAHPWHNFVKAWCSTFDPPEQARAALIGEAVERYCANNTMACGPSDLVSYEDLVAGGEHAVDPETLVLYSPRQHAQVGFPFVPFTRDLPVRWVKGRSLTRDTDAWLPASLVHMNWHMGPFATDPIVNYQHFAGVQAGPTLEFALVSAVEEVVERDAMMTWWSNRHALSALHLTDDLAGLWQGEPARLGQHAWAIHLDNQFDIPVVAGIVENTAEQFLTIGFAARPDARDATHKAWAEGLSLQEGSRDLLLPEGESTVRALLSLQGGNDDYLKPWRADRAYMDSYREDLHDVVQLLCQEQFYLDPRTRKRVAPWIDVTTARAYDDLPHLPDRTLATYRDRVERQGYEVFAAELTTPDVALCGLHVVRVLIPGLAPNFPAVFPTWGRGRIQDHAVHLGWYPHPPPEDQLNTFPLPYA